MSNLTLLPYGLAGKIFRCPMPYGSFDEGYTTFDEFKRQCIEVVVMLTSDEENLKRSGIDLRSLYLENQLEVIHLPVSDFGVPGEEAKLEQALQAAIEAAKAGKRLAVHCYAGRGRTGMFLALMARRVLGLDGEAAVAWVRDFFPAIETRAQLQRVLTDSTD